MMLTEAQQEAIFHVAKIMETDFFTQREVKDLAKISGLSEGILRNGFQELFGKPIMNEYKNIRMSYAKAMLAEGRQVKEVALTLHYSRVSSFTKAFKSVYGLTPSSIKVLQQRTQK